MLQQKLTEVQSKLDEVNYRLRRRFQRCKLKEVLHVNCADKKVKD
jgi:hypothetical protein